MREVKCAVGQTGMTIAHYKLITEHKEWGGRAGSTETWLLTIDDWALFLVRERWWLLHSYELKSHGPVTMSAAFTSAIPVRRTEFWLRKSHRAKHFTIFGPKRDKVIGEWRKLNDEGVSRSMIRTYLLTPWSRVLLEKLTSKLCS